MKSFTITVCVTILALFSLLQESEIKKLRITNSELLEALDNHEATLKDLSKANKRIKELEKFKDKYNYECLPENNYETFRNNE